MLKTRYFLCRLFVLTTVLIAACGSRSILIEGSPDAGTDGGDTTATDAGANDGGTAADGDAGAGDAGADGGGDAGATAQLTLSPSSATAELWGAVAFTANGGAADVWSSSNPAVATTDASGVATCVGLGETTISVRSGALSASATLDVVAPTLQSLTIAPTAASTVRGRAFQFRASALLLDAGVQDATSAVTWSADPGVQIDGGLANSTVGGTFQIAVTLGAAQAQASLDVATQRLAFVTSQSGYGDFDGWAGASLAHGLAAADSVCAAAAASMGLPGDYRAWLSDSDDDAYCRVHGLTGKKAADCAQTALPASAGPWIGTDGLPFGASIAAILGGAVLYPLRADERGALVADGEVVWTATAEDGTLSYPAQPCDDWTTAESNDAVGASFVGAASFAWTYLDGTSCNVPAHIYCFEVGDSGGPPLDDAGTPGEQVFVSSSYGDGNLHTWADSGGAFGIAAGDAVCQATAARAGLANAANFKAWLSDSQTDAIDRLSSNGPWVRADGAVVARSKADLTAGALPAAITMNELNEYVDDGVDQPSIAQVPWTGTGANGRLDAMPCSDWTDDTPESGTAAGGNADLATSAWTLFDEYDCASYELPLYCFEDTPPAARR